MTGRGWPFGSAPATAGRQDRRPDIALRLILVREATASGEPVALHVSGRRIGIESVLDVWRVEDEWWRERPVSRMYYRVLLEGGWVVDLYRALGSGRWYRQSH